MEEEVIEHVEDVIETPENEDLENDIFEIEEPVVRKTPRDYVLERRSKRLEKKELEEEEGDYELDNNTDIGRMIANEVQKALKPFADVVGNQSMTQEMGEVLNTYPELKGKEGEIKKYAEAYPNAPLSFIAKGLLFDKYQAQSGRNEAKQQAKSEQKGGNVKRPKEVQEKSAWDMTDEEFLQVTNRVRSNS